MFLIGKEYMDALICACEQMTLCAEWENNTQWDLYCMTNPEDDETHVYSNTYIPAGAFIGEIIGEQKYSWEVFPDKYIHYIDEDFILDCSKTPRCITSMVQEGFYDGFTSNCKYIKYVIHDQIKVGIFAIVDIYPQQKLIYSSIYNLIS